MIGQHELLDVLHKTSIKTFPRSLIICGDEGCGKHTFVSEIVNHLGIQCRYVSDLVNSAKSDSDTKNMGTAELVESIINNTYHVVVPVLYVFDETKDIYQNIMLKFLEEPSEYTYAVILCESEADLLTTVLNRCQIWRFTQYTDDELASFVSAGYDTSLLLKIFRTPGQIQRAITEDILKLYNEAEKILTCIQTAYSSNVLVLPERAIAYKKDDVGIPIWYLSKILSSAALTLYSNGELPLSVMKDTCEFERKCKRLNVDKKKLYENYLFKIRHDIREFKTHN